MIPIAHLFTQDKRNDLLPNAVYIHYIQYLPSCDKHKITVMDTSLIRSSTVIFQFVKFRCTYLTKRLVN